MLLKDLIKRLQLAMNEKGESLTVDGDAGIITLAALQNFDVEIVVTRKLIAPPILVRTENPAYVEAKKYAGKKESDSKFGKYLSGFWSKVGLPGFRTIVGSAFAWCGLFVFAMNTEVGQKAIASAAGARNWAMYGVAVDWKKNGIPKGAVIHINHGDNCASSKDNHVTFADGDCTAADLAKPGATFPGFGGNQSNTVKRSNFSAKEICEVRWPSEIPLPPPVTKSVDCSTKQTAQESTR